MGSAQVRLEGRLLQHGSVLLGDDQRRLADLLDGAPSGAPPPGPSVASLGEWLDPLPAPTDLADVLAGALRAELGGHWHPADTEPTLDAGLVTRLEDRYRSPEWTWRC